MTPDDEHLREKFIDQPPSLQVKDGRSQCPVALADLLVVRRDRAQLIFNFCHDGPNYLLAGGPLRGVTQRRGRYMQQLLGAFEGVNVTLTNTELAVGRIVVDHQRM